MGFELLTTLDATRPHIDIFLRLGGSLWMHGSLQFSGPLLCWHVLLFIPITVIWDALGIHFGTPAHHFVMWGDPRDRGSSKEDSG